MDMNELLRLREAVVSALAILDKLTQPKVEENTLGFVGFVERQNENLGTILRDAMIQVKGQHIRIGAPALVTGFLKIHSELLRELGSKFFSQPISKVTVHASSDSKD